MVHGVRLTKEQLVERFGVSRRVAVRACALLARGVELSAGFLESLPHRPEAEQFLLSNELLQRASGRESLAPNQFSQLADGCFSSMPPVLIMNDDGTRVIALASEAEAGMGTHLARSETPLPMLLSPIGTALSVISQEESEKLFTPEELARLKMTILTSADSAQKIEAIRRLVLSPLTSTQKGTVLIHALGDPDNRVRVEAADALTALGLNPVIAQSARSFGTGNARQRTHAAERLGMLAEQVSEAEISVILALLAGAIGTEESVPVKATLIESFKGACGIVAANRSYATALLRLLIRELEGAPEALYRPVRDILSEVGRDAPAMMAELILHELSTIKALPMRRLLFGVLAMFDVPEEYRAELAGLAVADLNGSAAPEEECQGVGNMLCDWGTVAVRPLLDSLPRSEDAQKIYIVRLLDEIAYRCKDAAAAERIAAAFLDLLRVSDKHIRMPIIESRVLIDARLPAALRERIAAELLAGVTQFANPRMRSVIETAVVRLGVPALSAVSDLLADEADEEKRKSACLVLTEIVAASPERARTALADRMLELCLQQWRAASEKKGYMAEAVGRLAALSSAPPGKLREIVDDLRAVILHTTDPFGILLALGCMNDTPRLELPARFEIAQTFFDLLDATLPELTDRVMHSELDGDEEVHQVGKEVTAYTEMIPACLEGLEKTYFGVSVKSLRNRVADFLIGKWNETSDWKTIWGPDAVGVLLHVLGRIASDPTVEAECRARIIEALARRIEFVPVLDELTHILSVRDSSSRIGAAACKIGHELLRRAELLRDNEQISALRALGAIASRTNLGKDPEAARRLRERTLHVLFNAIRNGRPEAVEALGRMENCAALPTSLREEVRQRLRIIAERSGQEIGRGGKEGPGKTR